MKLEKNEHACYIRIKDWKEEFKPLKTKELTPSIYLDYSKNGELIGIEILSDIEVIDEKK